MLAKNSLFQTVTQEGKTATAHTDAGFLRSSPKPVFVQESSLIFSMCISVHSFSLAHNPQRRRSSGFSILRRGKTLIEPGVEVVVIVVVVVMLDCVAVAMLLVVVVLVLVVLKGPARNTLFFPNRRRQR